MDHYDEVIEIKNGPEIDSPTDLDVKRSVEFINSDKQSDFLSMGSSSNLPAGSNQMTSTGPKMATSRSKPGFREESRSMSHSRSLSPDETSENSESVSRDMDRGAIGKIDKNGGGGQKKPLLSDVTFDPRQYENVDAPTEIKELMQYISRYTPQQIPIEYKLRIFIPDYIPAVGDIDAFLKVIPPEPINKSTGQALNTFSKSLGLQVVDEPCGQQSDGVLLQMRFRSIFPKALETPSAVAKSPKDIERWVTEIQTLHINQPSQNVLQLSRKMPEIDALMSEWPEQMEKVLDTIGFPPSTLDCSLSEYCCVVSSLFDIPINNRQSHMDHITMLYTLFSLYIAVKGDVN